MSSRSGSMLPPWPCLLHSPLLPLLSCNDFFAIFEQTKHATLGSCSCNSFYIKYSCSDVNFPTPSSLIYCHLISHTLLILSMWNNNSPSLSLLISPTVFYLPWWNLPPLDIYILVSHTKGKGQSRSIILLIISFPSPGTVFKNSRCSVKNYWMDKDRCSSQPKRYFYAF